MEIILKETIDNLGQEGDIVKVKPGYGRNYLLPKQKAVLANTSNLAILKQEQDAIKARLAKQNEECQAMAAKLNGITIEIARRVGEENKIFGSVTAADIAAQLGKVGIEVDKRAILLAEPLKTISENTVQIKIGYQATAKIKVQVIPEIVGDAE